jgi:hypothetical protein
MGGLWLFGVTIVCCKVRGTWCFTGSGIISEEELLVEQLRVENGGGPSERRLREREREEVQRLRVDRRMKLIEVKCVVIRYLVIKGENKQTSCCICFEDFEKNSQVRETPCHHFFHGPCLMQWVKQKLESSEELQADCPFCRQNLNI